MNYALRLMTIRNANFQTVFRNTCHCLTTATVKFYCFRSFWASWSLIVCNIETEKPFLLSFVCKGYSRLPNTFPASIYLFKVNGRNTKNRFEICLDLTIKTPERRHWRRSGVFIVHFEHTTFSSVSIVDFEEVNVSWVNYL